MIDLVDVRLDVQQVGEDAPGPVVRLPDHHAAEFQVVEDVGKAHIDINRLAAE
ncbi:hypothetical protein G5V57_17485 [Nordella sp. HKS 07]|uniref:hypothetical protein n=1 Tax=Nordella sp. HKS 07 TaxID=2712222 RepID=UPI0013E1630A|nr:hypothetical protein [Nordella sp. HKS 07]QIG49358.1 hypothetical protein G5V57_17485 [Nordella sp. HKS 07]